MRPSEQRGSECQKMEKGQRGMRCRWATCSTSGLRRRGPCTLTETLLVRGPVTSRTFPPGTVVTVMCQLPFEYFMLWIAFISLDPMGFFCEFITFCYYKCDTFLSFPCLDILSWIPRNEIQLKDINTFKAPESHLAKCLRHTGDCSPTAGAHVLPSSSGFTFGFSVTLE